MATRFQQGAIASQAAPVGTVQAFAGSSPPTGWLLCDGTNYSRTTYAALFAVIGTTYDTQFNEVTGGNYSAPAGTDFRVPDYRASFLRGVGTATGKDATTLGGRQGEKTKTPSSAFTTAAQALSGGATGANTTGAMNANATHSHHIKNAASGDNSNLWHRAADNQFSASGDGVYDVTTYDGATPTNTDHGHPIPSLSVSGTCPASTVNGGGDNETRPMNKGVNYIIKW